MTLRTRRLPVLALLLLLLLVSVRDAIAHAHLERSSPSAKAQLSAAPKSIRLWFSEKPQVAFTRVQLLGGDGTEVPLGPVTAGDEMSVSVDVRGPVAAGDYTVVWQTGAADGHPSRGRFSFSVKASAAVAPVDTMTAASADTTHKTTPGSRGNALVGAPTDSSASSPREQGAVRWLEFVALLVVIGVVVFRFAVVPALGRQGIATNDVTDSALRLGRSAAVLLFVAMWVRLYMEMRTMFGAQASAPGMLRDTILSTSWGHGWLFGTIGVVVVGVGFLVARRAAAGWGIAAIGALFAAMTPAFTGHAIATAVAGSWAVGADALHVIAAGAWIGTLATIVLAAIPALRTRAATAPGALGTTALAVVRAFNPVALTAAAVLVLSGLTSARFRVGTLAALTGSAYGKLLLLKIALVVLVAIVGAWNWKRLTPALVDDQSALKLRRSAILELTIAALVLALTAALVVSSPPMEANATNVAPSSMR